MFVYFLIGYIYIYIWANENIQTFVYLRLTLNTMNDI